MNNVLISNRPKLVPIYEFIHDTRIEKNVAYAHNLVSKLISKGVPEGDISVITLDNKKLQHKVHKGTYCHLFDRLGHPMKIQYLTDEQVNNSSKIEEYQKKYNIIIGNSTPQHGDKFSRYEGRMNALKNAYSNMKLIKSDPNFDDLLAVKRFINTFELEVNCTTVSYQFMDLWLAIVSNNKDNIIQAAKDFIGLEAYNEYFAEFLNEFDEVVQQYEVNNKLDLIDKYTLFKSGIKNINNSLF